MGIFPIIPWLGEKAEQREVFSVLSISEYDLICFFFCYSYQMHAEEFLRSKVTNLLRRDFELLPFVFGCEQDVRFSVNK